MFCKYCGSEIKDDATFCPSCGKKLIEGSGDTNDFNATPNYYQNPNSQQGYYQNNYQNGQQGYYQNNYQNGQQGYYQNQAPGFNQNSTGLNVLGFLLPLVGLILFCVYQGSEPEKARGIGKWSLIGFLIGIVCSVAAYACTAAMFIPYI